MSRRPFRISAYCKCGASCVASSTDAAMLRGLLGDFLATHKGDGHAPCDPAVAARARRKSEVRD